MEETTFTFNLTPLDPDRCRTQISLALEKRTELVSRKKYPMLWNITDKLNGTQEIPPSQRKGRKKILCFLGAFTWLASSFLLIPALVAPEELSGALTVASCCLGVGTYYLWRYGRTLLASFALALGLFLLFGALGNPQALGELLWLAIADLVIGIASLVTRKRAKLPPFDRAARKLLDDRQHKLDPKIQVQVTFSPVGMTIRQTGADGVWKEESPLPYSAIPFILETEDLILPISQDTVTVLLKKDLLTGTLSELRTFLRGQTQYVAVYPFQLNAAS